MTDVRDPEGRRIRTLVVDDETLARAGLRAMLDRDPALLVDECAGGRDAIAILRERPMDLVFLDVQMPSVDGFDVIAAVGVDVMPVVVFVTAYDTYAMRAFEACALDYVLKPVGETRLARAVARAKTAVRQRRVGDVSDQLVALLTRRPSLREPRVNDPPAIGAEHAIAPGYTHRVLLRSGAKSYYVAVDDIDWIESDTNYARLWTGVRSHLLRQSLNHLEAALDATRFVRVHRSAIVNVARVGEIRRTGIGRYDVVLIDGTRIPMSRDRKRRLHEALRARR